MPSMSSASSGRIDVLHIGQEAPPENEESAGQGYKAGNG